MAVPMNSWSDFRKVLKQLKDPAVKEKYETVIVDTADVAWDLCEKYICANAQRPDGGYGVDTVADIPYGRGYTLVAKEFDESLRSIVQMDYGLVLISHSTDKTFTDEQGREYNQIVPTLSARPRNIVSRMCDLIGYSRAIQDDNGNVTTKLFLRGTPRYVAGARFKYIDPVIDFTYDNLVKAINDAIDKQMKEEGKEYFTNDRNNLYTVPEELDFDELLKEFNSIITDLTKKVDEATFKDFWSPRITQIIERYLGKGQKVNNISREQTEALDLILTDLKELIQNNQPQ